MLKRKKALPALLSLPLLLAGCVNYSAELAPTNEIDRILPDHTQREKAGPPLPAGAYYEPADAEAADADFRGNPAGSWRPDDKDAKERVPDIVKRGRVIVGVDQSHNLLSYRDTTTGQMSGFEVDLAHEIARDIFDDPSKVDFRFLSSAERVDALESGEVDMVVRTMTINEERQEQVEFSTPYLDASTRLLALQSSGIDSLESTADKRVCATAGSTSLNQARLHLPEAQLLVTRSWGDCLMALQLSQADAVITDDTLLSGMVDQDSYTEIVGEPMSTESYGVGIKKSRPGADTRPLVRQVNSTLERLRRDGTWARLYDEWFGPYLAPASPPALDYRSEDPDDDSEEARND